MLNTYTDFQLYNSGAQHGEPHQVAYRLGNLALNSAAGYQNRAMVHSDGNHSYVEPKLYEQNASHHVTDCLPKDPSGFKTPDQPPPSSTGSWNSAVAVRPSHSPASSLSSIQSASECMRFDSVAYPRSMQDMYSACYPNNQAMNPGVPQNIFPWIHGELLSSFFSLSRDTLIKPTEYR
jgi:hypothetical protein